MAKAVIPRLQGDDYQGRFFWLQASRLFHDHTKVQRVAYEYDEIKSFDDVVVFYSEPIPDERGGTCLADYFQVKFHVDHNGAFTCDALIDPAFIGADKVSLLQKLRAAQLKRAIDGNGARFFIVSPWAVDGGDPLRFLISTNNGELRLDKLFDDTGDKSATGRVRKAWREHLELEDDRQLELTLRPLRIWFSTGSLTLLGDQVNDKLIVAGFKPVEATSQVFTYTPLIQGLHASGKNIFTRDELQEVGEREKLWVGTRPVRDDATALGLRSFMRRAESMEDWTERMLCLVHHFDNRMIGAPRFWDEAVFPEIKAFLSEATAAQRPYRLYLDTHNSIAFAAGYELDDKSGVDIAPMQSTRTGRHLWKPDYTAEPPREELWEVEHLPAGSGPRGKDVALAVSVSRDVSRDVRLYVEKSLPEVGRIIVCRVRPHPSRSAVRDATHAFQLVEELVVKVGERDAEERAGQLHILASAPNALLFFLGQQARGFGHCTVYEYDFETNTPGAYSPAIQFPPSSLPRSSGSAGGRTDCEGAPT